ncbi:MAG: 50S ribosomal protein L35 [Candidatus Omnitrophica bacterium]|nr:50S ribosomal protein L35 [Candidatus Omnitrophota bacterium]MCM8798474.1 50S ribosomal protein L35 [Candidatus Omnitrophota bacterium]
MPKMKTSRSLAKRIRFTATGKLKRAKAGKSHLLSKKRKKRKLDLRRPGFVVKEDREKLRKLLPYSL